MKKLLILVLILGICVLHTTILCGEGIEPMHISVHMDIFEDCTSIIPLDGGFGGGGPGVPG